jgi:hypothetical protein
MYEHRKQQLASKATYRKRVRNNLILTLVILTGSLAIGMLGYHYTIPEFDWYDCLLNASMILSGMGPIIDPHIVLTDQAKLFASVYALFSGITFLTTFGILIAPIIHRFFHKMHVENN